ncbi:MAG: hypothetical protein LUF91_07060, partial [Oscillospiraceae bacterium]|nr:hypothetical protein [Oscillospiraceae bacterium]
MRVVQSRTARTGSDFVKGCFLSNDAALKQCQKTVHSFHWNGRTAAFPGGKAMDQLSRFASKDSTIL